MQVDLVIFFFAMINQKKFIFPTENLKLVFLFEVSILLKMSISVAHAFIFYCPFRASTWIKTSHLSNKRLPALVVVLPTLLAEPGGGSAQVQGLRLTGQLRGVPVHVELRAAARLRGPGAVVHRKRQPAGLFLGPAAGLPPLRHLGVPAPVIRGEALEDDAHVDPRPGHGHHAHQGKDTPLTATKLADFLQDVIKTGHGCSFCTGLFVWALIYRNSGFLSGDRGAKGIDFSISRSSMHAPSTWDRHFSQLLKVTDAYGDLTFEICGLIHIIIYTSLF